MKIAILSGKGGAGKTLLAVNLAAAAEFSTYIDCDVEEPNGRIFLKPQKIKNKDVYTYLPDFDESKCIGCRKCVDFCKFNALIFIKKKPIVFSEVCHCCGGCKLVCPSNAVSEKKHTIGHLEIGKYKNVNIISGILNLGESSGIPIINAALKEGEKLDTDIFIDCPPGSACSVMESVSNADKCVLVAEPTAFGLHNFKMVYELVTLLKKPCAVVINKQDAPYEPLENFCAQNNIEILSRIPYSPQMAEKASHGNLISEENEEYRKIFTDIFNKIMRDTK